MPRPPRVLFPNAYYHAFTRGIKKRTLFHDDQDRRRWLELMLQAKAHFRCRYLAYCLMSNHVHLAVHTLDPNLDKVMEWIKRRYAKHYGEKYGWTGPLFEGRYKCKVVSRDDYLLALIRYVHLNPVKAGMVRRPLDYRWSSRSAYEGGREALVDAEDALGLLSQDPVRAREAYSREEIRPLANELWRRLDDGKNGFFGPGRG